MKTPQENLSIGAALLLLILMMGCRTLGPDNDPQAGALKIMTEKEEIKWGREISAAAIEDAENARGHPLMPDNPISLRVDALVQSLAPSCDRSNLRYQTTVVNDPRIINAYALPGGYVCVPTGMLEFLGNPDELSLVMAHELGHISGRHSVRMLRQRQHAEIRRGMYRILGNLLARAAGAYVGSIVPTAPTAPTTLPQQASDLTYMLVTSAFESAQAYLAYIIENGYGRARENQADRLGMAYVKRQGVHDPAAAIALFKRFDILKEYAEKSKQNQERLRWFAPALGSHPEPQQRIEQAREILKGMGISPQKKDTSEMRVPDSVTKDQGPRIVGPEVLPVPPDEAWFAFCRVAANNPMRFGYASREYRQIYVRPLENERPICSIRVELAPADPAGTEVTIAAVSSHWGWWPTILMSQLKAETGVAEYACLKGIMPGPVPSGCEYCASFPGAQQEIFDTLRHHLPWALIRETRDAGFLHYKAGARRGMASVKIVVSPEEHGACQVYVRQGPVGGEGKRAAQWVFDLLKKNRGAPDGVAGPK